MSLPSMAPNSPTRPPPGRCACGSTRATRRPAVFYVSYDKDGEEPRHAPDHVRIQRRARVERGVAAHRRARPQATVAGGPGHHTRTARPSGRQRRDLVALHRSGLRRSGRDGIQPRHSEGRRRRRRADGRPFWGIKSDLRSLAEFIRLYLNRNERWASPKYLAGESYGGFRAATLVDALPAQSGIELNGAILISPVIEYTLNLGNDYLNLMPWVTFVPSFAATAFHYGKYRGAGANLKQITEEAERFSRSELLLTLASDAPRKSAEVTRVFARLAQITGLDVGQVERHRGRITAEVFATRLLEDSGRVMGIYDGSVSAPGSGTLQHFLSSPRPEPRPARRSRRVEFQRLRAGRARLQDRFALRPDESGGAAGLELGRSRPRRSSRRRIAATHRPGAQPEVEGSGRTRVFRPRHALLRIQVRGRAAGARRDGLPEPALAVYPGGHMFFTRADARKQFYRDAKALYETPSVAPQR